MKKVIIDYSRLTAADLIELVTNVRSKLTDNANFPDLPVKLDDLESENDKLVLINTAAEGKDREKLAELRAQKKYVADLLRTESVYCNMVAAGDEAKLLSSGFELTRTPEKHGKPEQVKKIVAAYTNVPQTIELNWSRAKFARFYNVYMSADGGDTWSIMETTGARTVLCDALTSGTRYQFKVIAVNTEGESIASDIASQMAA